MMVRQGPRVLAIRLPYHRNVDRGLRVADSPCSAGGLPWQPLWGIVTERGSKDEQWSITSLPRAQGG